MESSQKSSRLPARNTEKPKPPRYPQNRPVATTGPNKLPPISGNACASKKRTDQPVSAFFVLKPKAATLLEDVDVSHQTNRKYRLMMLENDGVVVELVGFGHQSYLRYCRSCHPNYQMT